MNRREIIQGLTEIRDPEFLFAQQYLAEAQIDLAAQPIEARMFLETLSKDGVAEAQFSLSKLIIVNLLDHVDKREALKLCQRAADAEYAPAVVFLASFYCEGWGGLQRDNQQAIALLHKGAELGYPHAMALLATAYSEGIRVGKDPKIGRMFLIEAAEHGDVNSQYLLGVALLDSAHVDNVDQKEALRWVRSAAGQDSPSAHRLLANLYMEGGAGLSVDESLARFHRRQADRLDHDP
jgi:TPR repeat protein